MSNFDEEWRSRFEQFGRGYNADHLISGWSEIGLQRRLSSFTKLLAERNLEHPSQILDVGCGAGTYVRFLSGAGHKVIGLDYSFPSLRKALAADPRQSRMYLQGDAYRLPFVDEAFDLIVSIGTFQAMEHPQKAIKEMVRVLRPNGMVIVECLNSREIISQINAFLNRIRRRVPRVRTYSPNQIETLLLKCGVTVLKREGVYLPPRQLAPLNKILDFKVTNLILNGMKWMSLLTAHAFLLVGRKTL